MTPRSYSCTILTAEVSREINTNMSNMMGKLSKPNMKSISNPFPKWLFCHNDYSMVLVTWGDDLMSFWH
jgi:hypothetical protein